MRNDENDDWALLQSWRDGDRRAGDVLVQRHFRAIARFFHNKVNDAEDAAELVSQTFLACTESRHRFRAEVPFAQFVFRLAVNTLQQYLRKKYKRERERLDFGSVCLEQLYEGSLTTQIARKQELRRLAHAMRCIPLDFQIVLELNVFEGLSGREIGELLEIPEPTVRGRLRLGKQRLSEQLERLDEIDTPPPSESGDLRGWAHEIRVLMDRTAPVGKR
ncbi:MAG: RNA polymerase sigma factor [Myxococcota bacterium]